MADDAQRAEDGGVLGNLPHTRPGRRSEKRDAKAAKPRAQRAGSSPAAPSSESGTGAPLGDLMHGAEKVAGAGLRVAGGLAREVLRRLPRP
jgi:hypothetical protein